MSAKAIRKLVVAQTCAKEQACATPSQHAATYNHTRERNTNSTLVVPNNKVPKGGDHSKYAVCDHKVVHGIGKG